MLLSDKSIGFSLGQYDHEFPLVIDPELVFFVTYGSTGGGGAFASGVAIDSQGSLVLAGTADLFFPVADTIQGSNHAGGQVMMVC